MTRAADILRLQQLAGLVSDQALAQLGVAARRRSEIEARLAALNTGHAGAESSLALGQAGFRHELWAAARRAELNMALARQQVVWLQARDAAREAWGRTQALGGLGTQVALGERQLSLRRQLGET